MIGFFASRSRLADQLVKSSLLTRDQIRRAQEEASRLDDSLCATLIRLGLMEESTLVNFIAEKFDFPFVGRESLKADTSTLGADGAVKVVDFGLMAWPRYAGDSRYILQRPDSSPGEQDRHALGAMAYEMITGGRFGSGQSYKTHFDSLSASLKIHPLLKYFLARFWAVKEQYPPYKSYEDMLADPERVYNRLMAQFLR